MTTNFWENLDRTELDMHYNPTLWTPRLTPESLLPAHEKLVTTSSQNLQNTLQQNNRFETINTGNGLYKSKVDVCKPSDDTDQKTALVYIHGGWWQWFSKDHFTFVAKPFIDNGITVYIPSYKMAQDWENEPNPIQAIFQQVKVFIAQLLKDTEKNQINKIFISGHSAGGHLASMMALVDWEKEFALSENQIERLKGIISLSGLYDLRPLVNSFVNDAIKITEKQAEEVSPYYLLNIREKIATPVTPTYLVLPEYDPQEFYRQTREYQALLHKKGHHCNLIFVPKADHLDLIEDFLRGEEYLLTRQMLDIIGQ